MKTDRQFLKLTIVIAVAILFLCNDGIINANDKQALKSKPDVIIYDGVYPGWPWVSADSDGTFYCVFREGTRHMFSAEGRIMLCVSRDKGATWSQAKQIIDSPGVDDRNVAISSLSDKRLLLAYNTYTKEKKSQTMISFSSDKGSTWTTPQAVGPKETRTRAAVITLSDGSLFLPYYIAPGNGTVAARSTDNGKTWTTTRIEDTSEFIGDEWDALEVAPGRLIGLIRNSHGSYHIPGTLWKTESRDFGQSWSKPVPTNVICQKHNAPPHLTMQNGKPTLFYADKRMTWNSAVFTHDSNFVKWDINKKLLCYQYSADGSSIPDGSYLSSVPVSKTRRLVVDYEIRKDSKRITGYFVDFPENWGE
jgi:BNR repeat-like domain